MQLKLHVFSYIKTDLFFLVCNCLLDYKSIFLFKVPTSIDIILRYKGKPKKLILTLCGPEFTFCCPGKTCIMLLVNVSVVSDGFWRCDSPTLITFINILVLDAPSFTLQGGRLIECRVNTFRRRLKRTGAVLNGYAFLSKEDQNRFQWYRNDKHSHI